MGLVAKSMRRATRVPARSRLHEVDEWIRITGRPRTGPSTRRPFPSLLLVAPLVIAYEVGRPLARRARRPAALRTGADAWMRQGSRRSGFPTTGCCRSCLFLILLRWQVVSFYDWRFSPGILAGMVVESVVWAVVLLGISRLIDFGFSYLEQARPPLLAIDPGGAEPSISSLIGYIGAGVYEETLFRLDSGPGLLRRPPAPPDAPGAGQALAVTGSALLFALAHHAGTPGRAVHLVRIRLPLDGRRLFRLGLRPPRFRDRRRHAHDVRYPGRLDRAGGCEPQSAGGRALASRGGPLRIVHVSDIHFWQYAFNPLRLLSKRLAGMASLLLAAPVDFGCEESPSWWTGSAARAGPHPDHRRPDHDRAAGRVSRGPAALADWLARSRPGDDHPRQSRPLHALGPIARAGSSIFRAIFLADRIPVAAKAGPGHGDPGARPDRLGRHRQRQVPARLRLDRAQDLLARPGPVSGS